LAFLDPYVTNVRWSSLTRLAKFRRGKYKTELLMLLATPTIPRRRLATSFVEDTTGLFGSDEWLLPLRQRLVGDITAAEFRDEMANLMRWRLEQELRYQRTHRFQVKYAGAKGVPIYDLIFATDNPAGDKIMRDLFTRSTIRFPQMAAEAQDLNRQRARIEAGQGSLLDELPEDFQPVYKTAAAADLYRHEPPVRPLAPSDLDELPPEPDVDPTGVDPRTG